MKRKNISLLFIEIHIWLQSIISSKFISNYNKFNQIHRDNFFVS